MSPSTPIPFKPARRALTGKLWGLLLAIVRTISTDIHQGCLCILRSIKGYRLQQIHYLPRNHREPTLGRNSRRISASAEARSASNLVFVESAQTFSRRGDRPKSSLEEQKMFTESSDHKWISNDEQHGRATLPWTLFQDNGSVESRYRHSREPNQDDESSGEPVQSSSARLVYRRGYVVIRNAIAISMTCEVAMLDFDFQTQMMAPFPLPVIREVRAQ